MFDYEDNYDNYYEPSELDEALSEFKDGIYKMLNKDIAHQLEDQSSKIIRLERQITRKNAEISELRIEARKALKEGEQKERDRIIGKTQVGDIVYVVANQKKEKKCTFCKDGTIKGVSGKKLKCPECYGSSNKTYWETEVQEKTIKQVSMDVASSAYGFKIERRYYYVSGIDGDVTIYTDKAEAEKHL